MALLNYTTKIDVERTIGEIQRCLSKHGASAVMTQYDDNIVTALAFQITNGDNKISFRLPCDWRPVLKILENDPNVPRPLKEQTQAVRVAWRIIKDWVEAQMALVETEMVTTAQVFLPYAVMQDQRTLSEHFGSGDLLLGSGK
jgi:hypothetical protein